MSALAFAVTGVGRAQTEAELFRVVRETFARVLPVDAVTFGLYDAGAGTLRFLPTLDAGEPVQGRTVPIAGTPAERVIRDRRPLVTTGPEDPRGRGALVMGSGRRSRSIVRCPVIGDGQVLAMVSAQSYTADAFGPEDVEMVEIVAANAATALLNQRYRRQLTGTVEREQAAREALARSEERHRALVEQAHDLTAVVDPGGVIRYISPSCRPILGYEPAELVGVLALDLVRPEEREQNGELLHRRIAGEGEGVLRSIDFRHRDGGWRTLEVVGRSLVDHPAVRGVVFNARDVSDRQRAQRETEQALRRLREAQAVADIGDWRYDPATGRVIWSESLYRIYGVPPETELELATFLDTVHPEDRESVRAELEAARRSGQPYELNHRIVRPDGTVRHIHGRGLFEHDGRGRAVGAFGTSQDVTELRRIEQVLRSTQHRMRLFLDQMPGLLWMTDRELRFTWADGAGLQAMGQSPEETTGMSLYEYFETDDPDFLTIAKHRQALAGQPVSFTVSWKERTFDTHVEPLRNEQGAIIGTLGFSLDVTERALLEKRLREAQRLETIGRFAGGVAHDFNNILTVIDGHIGLVLDQLPEDAPARADLEEIRQAAGRASSLTRQLLAFSRKQVLQPRLVDLNQAVRELERMLQRVIGEDIRLETELAPEPGRVEVDPSQLQQILMNLAVNARDAMPEGGRLTIATQQATIDHAMADSFPYDVRPGEYMRLEVRDTGHGMEPEVAQRAFEPFYTTKPEGEGTGLGLATVYGIVKQSRGYVWLESAPGEGTRFEIYLPRARRTTAAQSAARPEPRSAGGHETVLLVEDEDALRSLARRLLQRRGYTVLEAADGAEALEICDSHDRPIDLVLTDVVMPNISGTELVQRLARSSPGIRPLYMSGYTEDEVLRRGVVADQVAFLQKPFTPADLGRKVREVLDGG